MKRLLLNLLVITFALSLYSCGYNGGVEREERVKAAWGQVENAYQRRADLIPNLVATVKGYATHEKDVLTQVTQARASATQIKIDPANLTPENIQRFEQAQNSLSGALSRLLVASENYPDLKANTNFTSLMETLESTENRIGVERKHFNDAVNDYNTYIRKFPNVIFAGWFGFEKKGYFQAKPGTDVAPEVKF